MEFSPQAGEVLLIDQPFKMMPHPAAPGFPYGQSGRRGTVYKVELESDHSFHALKVFNERFQDPRNDLSAAKLRTFAELPGLLACSRKVITPEHYPDLLKQYPQLTYAVIMPWIPGETWYDFILAGKEISKEQSLDLAQAFLFVLTEMEKRQLAHCDLSGANLLFQLDALFVALVDVEELYSARLKPPDPGKLPAGTPGYAHKTAGDGLWGQDVDRFAGAVLLAEILSWSNPAVREVACEGQLFDQSEMQEPSMRYQLVCETLALEWGEAISNAFTRAWFSPTIGSCPSFQEWAALLNQVARPRPSHTSGNWETDDVTISKPSPSQVTASLEIPQAASRPPAPMQLDQPFVPSGYYQIPPPKPLSRQAGTLAGLMRKRIVQLALAVVVLAAILAGAFFASSNTNSTAGMPLIVTGRLIDAQTLPVKGAIVSIDGTYLGANTPLSAKTAKTDADGKWAIGLKGDANITRLSVKNYSPDNLLNRTVIVTIADTQSRDLGEKQVVAASK